MNPSDTKNTEPKAGAAIDETTACFEDSMDMQRLCLDNEDDRATRNEMNNSQTSTNTATKERNDSITAALPNILDSWFELEDDNTPSSNAPTPAPSAAAPAPSVPFGGASSYRSNPRRDDGTRDSMGERRGPTK